MVARVEDTIVLFIFKIKYIRILSVNIIKQVGIDGRESAHLCEVP